MGLLSQGKQLDDRVTARWSWLTKPLPNRRVQFGFVWAAIFGGGLLLRLLLLPWSNTPSYQLWIYAGLTLPGLLLLAHGLRGSRRQRAR